MILKPKIIKKKKMDLITIPENFGKNQLDYIVAEILLNHVISNQSDPVITYGELALKIDPDYNPQNLGRYLGNLSEVCKENGLPLISGIVVNKDTGLPGDKFYDYFFKERSMSEWINIFEECKLGVMKCTFWQNLLDAITRR